MFVAILHTSFTVWPYATATTREKITARLHKERYTYAGYDAASECDLWEKEELGRLRTVKLYEMDPEDVL